MLQGEGEKCYWCSYHYIHTDKWNLLVFLLSSTDDAIRASVLSSQTSLSQAKCKVYTSDPLYTSNEQNLVVHSKARFPSAQLDWYINSVYIAFMFAVFNL